MKKQLFVVSLVAFLGILAFPKFSSAATTEELQAQIQALLAQIAQLQAQMSQQQPQQWCYDFKYNLNAQSRGKEVSQLQTALEKEGFEIDASEKTNQIFDESTASAVSGFQQKYRDEILTPNKLKYATGFVGKSTRAKLNSLYGCGMIRPMPIVLTTSTQPVLSISPPDITVGISYSYQFTGIVSNAAPNSDVKLYLQRPDGTMKFEDYYVGKTDSNGVLKAIHNQSTPAAYSGAYSAWVNIAGQKSNVVNINVTQVAKPFIASIYPLSGAPGTSVTLTGEGFNAVNNSIYVGDALMPQEFYNFSHDGKTLNFIVSTKFNWQYSHAYNIYVENVNGISNSDKTFIVTQATATQPVLSISPTTFIRGNSYTFKGAITNAVPNSEIKLYIQRPDSSMWYNDYFVGYTNNSGSFEVSKTEVIPLTGQTGLYKVWVTVGGQESYAVFVKVDKATIQPSITVLSPNGEEVLSPFSSYIIKWASSGFSIVTLDLMADYDNNGVYEFYEKISNGVNASANQFAWTAPDVESNRFKIRITGTNTPETYGNIQDMSDASFSITMPKSSNPYITVLSPNGYETLTKGSVYRIKWSSQNVIDKVSLGYSFGPGSLNWITTNIPNTEYYDWTVNIGNTTNTQAKIYIIGYQIGVGSWNDYSDNYFTVASGDASSDTINQMASVLESSKTILIQLSDYLKRF